MADLHQRVERLFDKHVKRVVLERQPSGELLVTEVEFASSEEVQSAPNTTAPLLPSNTRGK